MGWQPNRPLGNLEEGWNEWIWEGPDDEVEPLRDYIRRPRGRPESPEAQFHEDPLFRQLAEREAQKILPTLNLPWKTEADSLAPPEVRAVLIANLSLRDFVRAPFRRFDREALREYDLHAYPD